MPRSSLDDPRQRVALTDRQVEVVRLIDAGLTNPQIAERLGISLDGVKWHVREILMRLDVESRAEAAQAWRAMRPRPWPLRVLGGLMRPALVIRGALAGAGLAVAVGAVAVVMATREGGANVPVVQEVATTPTAAVRGPACLPSDLTAAGSKEQSLIGDTVILELTFVKPRTCELSGSIEAFAVAPGSSADGPRLAQDRKYAMAPVGSDTAVYTVIWRNWCYPLPSPTPTFDPADPQSFLHRPPPATSLVVATSPDSWQGTVGPYPPCVAPSSPPTVELSVRSTPDPPATVLHAGPPPYVLSKADLPAFARWFAGVIANRDDDAIRDIALGYPDASCTRDPASGTLSPNCNDEQEGATLRRFVLDTFGSRGFAVSFWGQVRRSTIEARGRISAGCAIDAPNCERFTIAAAIDPPQMHRFYDAWIFEVVDGEAVIRGMCWGNTNDVAVVLTGGTATTAWGPTEFAPVR